LYADTVIGGVTDVLKHVGAFEQGFGRDAAPVEAYPPERFALYHGGFKTQLTGAYGGDVSPRATAEHYDVVFHGVKIFKVSNRRQK
jgi:hypothetical protein